MSEVYVLGAHHEMQGKFSRRVVSIPSALYWEVMEIVHEYLDSLAEGKAWNPVSHRTVELD